MPTIFSKFILICASLLVLSACGGGGGGDGGSGGPLAPVGLNYTASAASYTTNVLITPNTPSSSGGAVVSYAVSPVLPAGLSFDTGSGEISGTPTAITNSANYTVIATNAVGSTNANVSITVNDVAPGGLSYPISSANYITTNVITPNTPRSSGGAVVSYAVSPALPTGLSLDTNTGEITGTPTASTSATDYTVTATNTGGSTNVIVSITVFLSAPTGVSYSTPSATYLTNVAIAPNIPSNSGGPAEAYAVSPALPTGLSLDTTTGEITGTPTVAASTADYTVFVSNAGGSSGAIISITVDVPSPRFAYVTHAGGNISIYSINAITGQLRSRGYTNAGGDSLTIDPSGKFAYVTISAANLVNVFRINASTGALTEESSVATGAALGSLTIDPTGRFAYTAHSGSNSVYSYSINASTGALTSLEGQGWDTQPTSVTVDPSGQFAYVVNQGSGNVRVFSILSNGTLSSVEVEPAGLEPTAIAVDPSGQFAYVTNGGAASVSMYSINPTTGALTGQGSIAAGDTPVSITIDPSGQFAYVANSGANAAQSSVKVYSLNTFTGDLTLVETVVPGTAPEFVTIDPSGQFAYVANKGSSNIAIYDVNASTGALTPLAASSKMIAGNSPTSIAISKGATALSYAPKFAYTANNASATVSAYSINTDSGNLNPVNIAVPLPLNSTQPVSMTIDPAGEYAYVTNHNGGAPGTVTVYSIDTSTGDLTFVKTENTIEIRLNSVAVDPSGRYIHLVSDGDGSADAVLNFEINTGTGVFGNGVASAATGSGPTFIAIDPSGRFAYVTNSQVDNILAYTRNGAGLTAGAVEGTGDLPWAIAIDPSGQFAYVVNRGSTNNVSSYRINSSTGALTSTGAVSAGTTPTSIAIDPSGQFAYVANRGSDDVSVYNIDASTGVLTTNSTVDLGLGVNANPESITVDPSGQFVYVANKSLHNVSKYKINAISGGLTATGGLPATAGTGPQSIVTMGELIDVAVQKKFKIGDTGPAGGIVFYVTALGDHGLESAPADLNGGAGVAWGCGGVEITGADNLTIGGGAQNTADILAGCSDIFIAARIADAYSLNGFDDWFLPSIDELKVLFAQKDVVGGFANDFYLSSTEDNSTTARVQNFLDGSNPNLLISSGKNYNGNKVRAVRIF